MAQHFGVQWKRVTVEFLTIVVGVLVALTVDSLAKEREERQIERQYLRRLVVDLTADTAELGRMVRTWRTYEESGSTALQFMQDSTLDSYRPDEIVSDLVLAGFVSLPNIETATYDELKSSGYLRLLRNGDLRASLARYQAQLAKGDPFIERMLTEFRTEIQKRVPGALVRAIGRECRESNGERRSCRPESAAFDMTAFLTKAQRDSELQGWLNIHFSEIIRVRELMEERLASALTTLNTVLAASTE